MTEQPTREEIEAAVARMLSHGTLPPRNPLAVVTWAARAYLASLDASAPRGITRDEHSDLVQALRDGTELLDASTPFGPSGVSDEMVDVALAAFDSGPKDSQRIEENLRLALEAALAPLLEENARLREAYEEAYGVNEVVARAEKAEARVKELEEARGKAVMNMVAAVERAETAEARIKELEARESERLTDPDAIGFQFLELLQQEQARIKELEEINKSLVISRHKSQDRLAAAEARMKELEAHVRALQANVIERDKWCDGWKSENARLKITIADLKAALAEATGEPFEIERKPAS